MTTTTTTTTDLPAPESLAVLAEAIAALTTLTQAVAEQAHRLPPCPPGVADDLDVACRWTNAAHESLRWYLQELHILNQ
jgi:hypothetical protein